MLSIEQDASSPYLFHGCPEGVICGGGCHQQVERVMPVRYHIKLHHRPQKPLPQQPPALHAATRSITQHCCLAVRVRFPPALGCNVERRLLCAISLHRRTRTQQQK